MYDTPGEMSYFGGTPGNTNDFIIDRVVDRCYLPAGKMFHQLIKNEGLKISYSFTGTVLEQLAARAPDVLQLYSEMYASGGMELICETHYHSLAAFYDWEEFQRQIALHCQKLKELFGATPRVFRNTELTYRDDVGEFVRRLGFRAMFTEGWDTILDWRSPNFMYSNHSVALPPEAEAVLSRLPGSDEPSLQLKLLLKNYRRSDDIAFRFQLQGWEGYPVTAEKFADWVAAEPGYLTTLCMDYETVGEHHRVESGIFEFYKHLPSELAKRGIEFILPSEAVEAFAPEEPLSYPQIVSWADAERDLSAWTGNEMQKRSLDSIYKLGKELKQLILEERIPSARRDQILDVWGKLQTSDHYYYMSTKYWGDGDVHRYFSPYETPYQACINFQSVMGGLRHKAFNSSL